jgi:hypothetical protein
VPSELFHVKLTEFPPVAVEPVPVPIVVQPVANTTASGSPSFAIERIISVSSLCSTSESAADAETMMLGDHIVLISSPSPSVSAVMK